MHPDKFQRHQIQNVWLSAIIYGTFNVQDLENYVLR